MATFSIVANDTYEHNHRKIATANAVFCNTENEYFFLKNKDDEIKKRIETYQKNKNRKLDSKTILEREFILEVSENTTIDDLRKAILNEFEGALDTKIFSIAIHRDEGELISKKDGTSYVSGDDFYYHEKTGIWSFENGLKYNSFEELEQDFIIKKNYHAHVIFSGLRSDGTSIKDYKNERVKNKEIEKFDTYFMQKWCVEKKEQLFQYLENQGKLTQKELENRKKNDDSLETPADSAIQNLLNKVAEKLANEPSDDLKEVFGDRSINFNFKKTFAFKHIMSDLNKLLRGEKLAKNEIKALKTNLKNAGVFDPIILKSRILELSKQDLEQKYTKENVKNILKNLMNDEKYLEFKEVFLETYREIDKMKKAEFLAKYPDFQIFESVLNQDLEKDLEIYENLVNGCELSQKISDERIKELESKIKRDDNLKAELINENKDLKARIQELENETPKEVIKEVENPVNIELQAENAKLKEQIKALEKVNKQKDDFINNLGKMLNFQGLNYTTPLNELERFLNQKEQKNDELQGQDEKNQNLSHSEPSNMETALSNVSDAKINGDDDSAMKALRNNEKLYSENNKENKETTSQEEHQDQEQSSVKRNKL
ncbi:hypothetical protein A0M37_00045 [Campylobacter jejuni]|uniref:hypothetical protein n=1 Tax=Campylobacter jejuni TaxID=197 RepID=UPI0008753022|nr:hypothetical protein [Campylobacter jejuni]EAL9012988.1 hypothetical protein [Campylobacter coli]OEW98244.1 hypothetical protein A0M37_00045 [Campylobacter jejuni]OEX00365.1 hypothetical protein A0M41_08525 [Campylobacter jejuni]